jgi:hypothetical protein
MVQSYTEEGQRRHPEEQSTKVDLSDYCLTLIALLFLSRNARITHRIRAKALEFLEGIDDSLYQENTDLLWRLALARGVARAVMRQNAQALTAVEHRVLEDTTWCEWHAAFFQAYRSDSGHAVEGELLANELSDELVAFVDEYISTRLRFVYLWRARPFLRDVADRIAAVDMGDIPQFNEDVLVGLERIVQQGRKAKALGAQGSHDFRTGDNSFEAAIRLAHAARNRPQSVVQTGVRLLNDMLGGGYEGGRVYVHFGRSGDWKSGLLVSVAMWACDPRFNPAYTTSDPTRKPCVIYLSQENDMVETIERMVSYALGSDVDLGEVDVDELVRAMEDALSSEVCDFVFKYRASRSITTADMEAMILDEYIEGREVVMFVQDYIKRAKPVEQFRDQRHLELGAIVDEESTIAKHYGIPFVTAQQLTRESYAKMEAAVKAGRTDGVRELGASQASESIMVFENCDVAIFQARVEVESLEGRSFLTLRRGKMRGKRKGGTEFCAQPFELDADGDTNEMRLAEDAHLPIAQIRGMKDLGDGLAAAYDPNAPAGEEAQRSSTERRAARGAQLVGVAPPDPPTGGGAQSARPTRRASRPPAGSPRELALPTGDYAGL